jgi:hypothetical protein
MFPRQCHHRYDEFANAVDRLGLAASQLTWSTGSITTTAGEFVIWTSAKYIMYEFTMIACFAAIRAQSLRVAWDDPLNVAFLQRN